MTSQLVTLRFLLGNICISTVSLVVQTYFRNVQHISLPLGDMSMARAEGQECDASTGRKSEVRKRGWGGSNVQAM